LAISRNPPFFFAKNEQFIAGNCRFVAGDKLPAIYRQCVQGFTQVKLKRVPNGEGDKGSATSFIDLWGIPKKHAWQEGESKEAKRL
jgi:hypothetical protein